MKKRIPALLLAFAMMFALVACESGKTGPDSSATDPGKTTQPGDAQTFILGAYLPLSGSTAAYGQEARNAAELAVKIINENGGFNGAQVKFICYDTQSNTEEALKCATKLVEQDNADAVIMSVMSSEIAASSYVLNDAGIIAMVCGGSDSLIDPDKYPYIFRAQINALYTVSMTVGMMNDLNYTSVCVFRGPDESAYNTGGQFIDACKKANLTVLADETYDVGDTDYSAQVINMLSKKPDVVYISMNGEDAGIIVKQLRQQGYNGIILDKESFMLAQQEVAGAENSDYIAFSNLYLTYDTPEDCTENDTLQKFLYDYQDMYGKCPATDSSYRAYDNVMALWEASKVAKNNDSTALANAMNSVTFEGLGGTCDFTSGAHEGYETFGSFILLKGKNLSFENWLRDGGYGKFLTETGRDK